ncbi:hypothetical protein H5410_045829 [Solanum commersonii]|uniref:Uncharacterized protein n=1 Tax=Solanum commersonii TaxID=4109 RepID=A0A9J5XAM6_SOLCO|nr:hypothetical protein H5410_045829 [Solanum commersonii]
MEMVQNSQRNLVPPKNPQIADSITPHIEVIASLALNFREIFSCSPTLVLSDKKSQNYEAQSVVKPSLETTIEDLEVVFRVVSSTMSKRLFEGDLPEGKGTKSNILTTAEELVVPYSTQTVFDQNRKLFDVDTEEEEKEETHLVWRRKGVRGANVVNLTVSDPETIVVMSEAKLDDEPTKSKRKRKRKGKGKGKMVDSQNKGGRKRRYVTRGSCEMEFDDIVKAVARRKKEVEVECVKAKGGHKSVKRSPVKEDNVNKRAHVKPKPVKGPGPPVQKLVEENVLTRVERIAEMEKQKVLNGRVFDPEILTEFSMSTFFDSITLQSWEHLFEASAPYLHEPEKGFVPLKVANPLVSLPNRLPSVGTLNAQACLRNSSEESIS